MIRRPQEKTYGSYGNCQTLRESFVRRYCYLQHCKYESLLILLPFAVLDHHPCQIRRHRGHVIPSVPVSTFQEWPEIQRHLNVGQTAFDRADLCARVINQKLHILLQVSYMVLFTPLWTVIFLSAGALKMSLGPFCIYFLLVSVFFFNMLCSCVFSYTCHRLKSNSAFTRRFFFFASCADFAFGIRRNNLQDRCYFKYQVIRLVRMCYFLQIVTSTAFLIYFRLLPIY